MKRAIGKGGVRAPGAVATTGRRAFLETMAGGGAFALAGCMTAGTRENGADPSNDKAFSLGGRGKMIQRWPGLREKVRVWIVGDTHCGLWDARDDRYAGFYRRMCFRKETYARDAANCKRGFEKMLDEAKKEKIDLLLLAGDILSAPTLANVEFVTSALKASGLDWLYTAGNHDWHFEGDEGSDAEQRDRWIARRLGPLYRAGVDPLMHSKVVRGVRFVMIDDSDYLMLPRQTAFWKAEAAKGDPVVLVMHIPLWTEAWGVFTVGCPTWGAKTDPYWEIERRQKWAERPSDETFAFREAVLSTPNLVGVFTGHHHVPLVARERGQNLISVPRNTPKLGEHLDLTLAP